MRRVLEALADGFSAVWRIIPQGLRERLFFALLVIESRGKDAAGGMRRLFAVEDRLRLAINERAMALGKGVHPKHRLTNYHRYFIDRLAPNARVLDVGCGYGAVARSIAAALPEARVTGIDYHEGRLAQAKAAQSTPNLSFVLGDATKSVPEGGWDAIVLSNVLEHIVDRPGLLKALRRTTGARQFLIRVPLFEREWQMAMRRELGVNYYSDPDHKVEHRLADFDHDMEQAGLEIAERLTLWGEIWADCRVREPEAARQ